ncbi:MAG: hypothetical protein KVP17_000561 [Porospora cf. gigantea B]|uniref:uncharacterized protein n=2 Tax=Porospora cf. gigantea B TaxID=2853592 RepID=UPI003571DF3C|nr:MAG: hypothetical protein KVP17_000561 [Porospora cf. gigantea B]
MTIRDKDFSLSESELSITDSADEPIVAADEPCPSDADDAKKADRSQSNTSVEASNAWSGAGDTESPSLCRCRRLTSSRVAGLADRHNRLLGIFPHSADVDPLLSRRVEPVIFTVVLLSTLGALLWLILALSSDSLLRIMSVLAIGCSVVGGFSARLALRNHTNIMFMTYICVSFLMVMSSVLWATNIYSLVDSLAEFAILTTVNIETSLPFVKDPRSVEVPPPLLACLCLAVDSTTGNCQDANNHSCASYVDTGDFVQKLRDPSGVTSSVASQWTPRLLKALFAETSMQFDRVSSTFRDFHSSSQGVELSGRFVRFVSPVEAFEQITTGVIQVDSLVDALADCERIRGPCPLYLGVRTQEIGRLSQEIGRQSSKRDMAMCSVQRNRKRNRFPLIMPLWLRNPVTTMTTTATTTTTTTTPTTTTTTTTTSTRLKHVHVHLVTDLRRLMAAVIAHECMPSDSLLSQRGGVGIDPPPAAIETLKLVVRQIVDTLLSSGVVIMSLALYTMMQQSTAILKDEQIGAIDVHFKEVVVQPNNYLRKSRRRWGR